MTHTVKSVADLAGVSIRALHHYDRIGLLRPASVSRAGYRLYTDEDLERLQQVLFFRELGFSLRDIKDIIDRPDFDRKQALITHKALLQEKQQRLQRLIASVDRSIDALERGVAMEKDTMFDGFDASKMEEYREEARAKYGKEIVDESYRRVAHHTKDDWAKFKAESQSIVEALASLMERDPSDPAVQEQIDRHFRQINDHFYTPTPEVYRGLGDLYISDSRFTANYDTVRPGLAAFMREAMRVYADRLEAANS